MPDQVGVLVKRLFGDEAEGGVVEGDGPEEERLKVCMPGLADEYTGEDVALRQVLAYEHSKLRQP